MILDALLQFSTADNLAIAVGTQASVNVIDLHMAGIPVLANLQGARDIGIGDDPALKLLVQVSTTFTSGGAGTLSVALQGAPDNGSGLAGTFVTWWLSPAYALATLVQGARLYDMDMPRPPAGVSIPRFLRLLYTVAGATMTAGNVSAYLVLDRHDQPYSSTGNAVLGGYPAGITIVN
jgi:hypothetical protein